MIYPCIKTQHYLYLKFSILKIIILALLTFAWIYFDGHTKYRIAERFHQINEYLNGTFQKSSDKVFTIFF